MRRLASTILVALGVAAAALGARGVAAQPAPAPAPDAVALLSFDTSAGFELYSQAVASEIARSLEAGTIAVVVVGPKAAVPAHARLIVDGTIAAGKAGAVVLSVRVRNPRDGTVIETLSSTAPGIANIDRAAADLSARVLPVVRERLAALRPGPEAVRRPDFRPDLRPEAQPVTPAAPSPVALLFGVGVSRGAVPVFEALRVALHDAGAAAVVASRREPREIDISTFVPALAPQTVATSGALRGLVLEVLDYEVVGAEVPIARARVRIRIADPSEVLFDRVIVTDSVVGDRRMPIDAIAQRVAREVLAIARPHIKRTLGTWP